MKNILTLLLFTILMNAPSFAQLFEGVVEYSVEYTHEESSSGNGVLNGTLVLYHSNHIWRIELNMPGEPKQIYLLDFNRKKMLHTMNWFGKLVAVETPIEDDLYLAYLGPLFYFSKCSVGNGIASELEGITGDVYPVRCKGEISIETIVFSLNHLETNSCFTGIPIEYSCSMPGATTLLKTTRIQNTIQDSKIFDLSLEYPIKKPEDLVREFELIDGE